jgi:hypothetical protein
MVQAWMANNPGLIPPAAGPTLGPAPLGAPYVGAQVSTGVTITVVPGVIGAGVTGSHAQLAGLFTMDENGTVTGDTLAAK